MGTVLCGIALLAALGCSVAVDEDGLPDLSNSDTMSFSLVDDVSLDGSTADSVLLLEAVDPGSTLTEANHVYSGTMVVTCMAGTWDRYGLRSIEDCVGFCLRRGGYMSTWIRGSFCECEIEP